MKMNRKIYTSIFAALAVLALGLLTGCSSSSKPAPTIAITASGGTPQNNVVVGTAFAALQATVTSNGSPASGVTVTFAVNAASNGATCTPSSTSATTNSSGQASITCTAGDTAGSFTVTATTTGTTTSASFSLSSVAAAAATISIGSGNSQSATVSTAFANPLVANVVDAFSNPVAGVSVTFTVNAGSTGASGAFGTSASATDNETTDANGNATTSQTLTANGTAGTFTVTASSGSLTSVNFTETNTAVVVVTSNNYVFYASGQELPNASNGGNYSYYAIAGALTIDANGNIVGNGEEDYNDGKGNTSPGEPNTPDTITAELNPALVVDPTTGIGTLTLLSSNANTGVGGMQVFAVQFVNANHALITQFDGSATSSGSLDLQTAPGSETNYSFAITGTDTSFNSWAFGGVFGIGSTGITGTLDENDASAGATSTGNSFSATPATADSFGRSVITGITDPLTSTAITFASYTVGPEAMRIIDVDFTDTGVGSAFGQTGTTFNDASLGSSVFTMAGQWSAVYASAGQVTTDGGGNITGGIADDNEIDTPYQQEGGSVSGTYDLVSSGVNGYGSIALSGDGDITTLGLYAVGNVNINDPNNTTTDMGGALVVDLDTFLPGGMGVVTPQTDTTATDFNGNYAAGFQNFNDFAICCDVELDMVGPFTVASGVLSTASIGADDSDPSGSWTGTPAESTGDSFSSTPLSLSAGYFTMVQPNNPLAATINGGSGVLDADIYQASATTLYWIEFDTNGLFLGPIETQGSLTGMPAAKKPVTKAQPKQPKPGVKGPIGQLR